MSELNKVVLLILIIFLICFMSGCSTLKPQYIDTTIEQPKLNAPDPRPLVLNDVEWYIVSDKNIDQFLPRLKSGELVIIGVDAEDYKLMAIDNQKILNYIKAQKNVIVAYRQYYEGTE